MKVRTNPFVVAKKLLAALMCIGSLTLVGCDFFSENNTSLDGDPNQLYPVQIDGDWGYINGLGRITILPQYDRARDFSEGLAAVQLDAVWGFVSPEDGSVVVQPQYQVVGNFAEGLAFVQGTALDAQYGFIDRYRLFSN